ncbi:MAG: STAS domain-containing protein [Candidatus Acidoferrales bacterium]|nr:STAS domain-containing protein [Acidobacteriia bacterium AH_259_A11_L15]
MKINVRKTPKATILDLQGPLKMGEAVDTFRDQTEELLGAGTKNLAINLAGVPEMDSSGIGILVRVFTTLKQSGGKCKVFGAPKRVMQALKMVRLDTVLDLAANEEAALAGF